MHLDPSTSSHNYGLVIAHKEVFYNHETKKKDWEVIVDYIHHWSPSADDPIKVDVVDEYVIDLCRRFHIGMVTYDIWNSHSSVAKLRKIGIPSKQTHYSRKYKNIIYDNLYEIVINKKLKIPHHELLKGEMLNLQRKYSSGSRGYKVYPKSDGDPNTDDVTDALVGAVYACTDKETNKLPQGVLTSFPITPSSNNRQWNSMSRSNGIWDGISGSKRIG